MGDMAYPYEGLLSFQQALQDGRISPSRCILYPDLLLLLDDADGQARMTYALVENGVVKATVVYLNADAYEGLPCFQVGYAVAESFRKQGIAADVLKRSIEEMRNGFKRHMKRFYIEAVVSEKNLASRKIAERILSSTPDKITDTHTGLPALQYFLLVET
jgi:predicted GNAT family acetyltransferase